MGFKGTIYNPRVPTQINELAPPKYDIDVSFRDISANIKFAFMGAGEYRYKRFVTQFNITSLILQGDAITPVDLVLQGLAYRFEYVSGDFSAGYFVVKKPKIEVGVMLGLKFLYTKIGGSGSLIGIVDFDL